MKIVKPFLAANNNKAQNAIRLLQNKYDTYELKNSNVIVVLGGDGSILSLINNKEYLKKKFTE